MGQKEELSSVIRQVLQDGAIELADIPQIDLYIDQITTLVDSKLSGMCRTPEDKLLTKAMVNNYSKEKLISPTKGKKYNREQIIRILMICYLKQVLSIQDIKRLLSLVEGEEVAQNIYEMLLREKQQATGQISADTQRYLSFEETMEPADAVGLIVHLALLSSYTKRVSEALIDRLFSQQDEGSVN